MSLAYTRLLIDYSSYLLSIFLLLAWSQWSEDFFLPEFTVLFIFFLILCLERVSSMSVQVMILKDISSLHFPAILFCWTSCLFVFLVPYYSTVNIFNISLAFCLCYFLKTLFCFKILNNEKEYCRWL